MIDQGVAIYLFAVGICGVLIIWWSDRRINRTERKRKRRIKKFREFESVETSTPVDNPIREARETAVDSIESRFSIIRKVSFFSLVIIWVLALVYPFLGSIPAAFISVLVASSGIIIGVAARPFIENLISGIVISFSHPIRIGDTVIVDNYYGSVEDITLTHTVIKIWNWRRYIIPNQKMLSKEIVNCTINDAYQWTHVEFYAAYDADLDLVRDLAVRAASESSYFAEYEEPKFWIMEMEEKGVKCWIAAWADSPWMPGNWEMISGPSSSRSSGPTASGPTALNFAFRAQGPKMP